MSNINLSDLCSLHRLSLDPALRDAVVKECEVLSADECPNLWIRAQDVPSAPAFATQLLVHKIHQLVMSSRLSSGYAGVELWVQVTSLHHRPCASACLPVPTQRKHSSAKTVLLHRRSMKLAKAWRFTLTRMSMHCARRVPFRIHSFLLLCI